MKNTKIILALVLAMIVFSTQMVATTTTFAANQCKKVKPSDDDAGNTPEESEESTPPEEGPENPGSGSVPQTPGPGATGVLDIKLLMKLSADSSTIAPNGSVELKVTGGTGDYNWSLNGGNGYTMADADGVTQGTEDVPGWEVTTNTTNTLIAGTCAAGAVSVTVVDADSQTDSITIENDAVASWTLDNTFTVNPAYQKPAEITGANAVWVFDDNGNKLYREEVTENYKVEEYYAVAQTTALTCDTFWGADGYLTCSTLCNESQLPVCDFWLLGNGCTTYFEGESTGNDYKFPCCEKQCLVIQERYVYKKTCQ